MGGEIKSKVRRFAQRQKARGKRQKWPSGWPAGDIVGWAASPDRPGEGNFILAAVAYDSSKHY